jgi:hypothetical protein
MSERRPRNGPDGQPPIDMGMMMMDSNQVFDQFDYNQNGRLEFGEFRDGGRKL